MKTIERIILACLCLTIFSCEILNDENDLTVAERLEGRWEVEDKETLKSADDAYEVYIDISPLDSNSILIDNFHYLDAGAILAEINGLKLEVREQDLGGFLIYGSATISTNYKQMSWKYFVDDGSGIWDEFDALYTKKEEY